MNRCDYEAATSCVLSKGKTEVVKQSAGNRRARFGVRNGHLRDYTRDPFCKSKGDDIVQNRNHMEEKTKSILVGSLLGDGWLTAFKSKRKSSSYCVKYNDRSLGYLGWIRDQVAELEPCEIKGKPEYSQHYFYTRYRMARSIDGLNITGMQNSRRIVSHMMTVSCYVTLSYRISELKCLCVGVRCVESCISYCTFWRAVWNDSYRQ